MTVLVERCLEWGATVMVTQIDFAQADASVSHGALLASMRRRQVPEALAAAYLRELRHASLAYVHGTWRTDRVAPRIGLIARRLWVGVEGRLCGARATVARESGSAALR